jgi:DNA-binding transcriptional LysR family regulator
MPVLAPWVPELSALELLLTVAGEGSLGRAAAVHGVSQPAVSSRIKGLERLLGFALLERGARGSSLTARGALVAEWARGVVDAAASLEAGIAALRADSQARLTVAASLTIAEYLLPGWLAEWRARQPDIQISLIGINSAAAAQLVLDGKVDLGFIEGPMVPPGLSARIIGHDRLVVVAAPGHPWTRRRKPIEPKELAATPLVQREPGSGTRVALEHALRGHSIAAPALELRRSPAHTRSAMT